MNKKNLSYIALFLLTVLILFLSSKIHYLLFHTLIELIPIIIAMMMFVITINTMKYMMNKYLVFIGISYFFIAIIDLFHMITFTGMPIFQYLNYPANQFWIAARFLEASMYFIAFVIIFNKKTLNIFTLIISETIILVLVMVSILGLEIFPVCYIEGSGQTLFKIVMEYVIILILVIALISVVTKKRFLTKRQFNLYILAIIFTILSESSFTLYFSNYGNANMIGHFFKFISFLLIYINIVSEGLNEPLEHIFKELEEKRKKLADLVVLDELTQITNRRGIFEKGESIWKDAINTHQYISIFMIDVDNFKAFNDFHGHIKGDAVLKQIACSLKQLTQASKALLGRYGGEEFLIVQSEIDFDQAQLLAESLLESIRKMNLPITDDQNQIVTISLGLVSIMPTKDLDFEEAIVLADEQLYKAKNHQKNCSFAVKL